MSLVVRPATEDDVPGIVDAYLDSWRGGYQGLMSEQEIEVQVELRREHDWRSAILSPTSEVVVALSDRRLVGVAQATELSDPARDLPEITMLYVRPDSGVTGSHRCCWLLRLVGSPIEDTVRLDSVSSRASAGSALLRARRLACR